MYSRSCCTGCKPNKPKARGSYADHEQWIELCEEPVHIFTSGEITDHI